MRPLEMNYYVVAQESAPLSLLFKSQWANPPGIIISVSELTRILDQIKQGGPQAAEQLLPLVYDELRKLAAHRLANEKPGQTLQATALVHEAYLRLVGDQQFENRGHFFAAAAEAMRRIVVEAARRKQRAKHGGGSRSNSPTCRPVCRPTIFSHWTRPSVDSRRLPRSRLAW